MAERSWLGQVYLDWSSWPLIAEVGPSVPRDAQPGSPELTAVSFVYLRFLYDTSLLQGRHNPPLSGMVYVDAGSHVAEMNLGGKVQH